VLGTGAASRGSGNANTNKEKDMRRWFVEQDLIEGLDLPAGKPLLPHHRARHHPSF
jgi:hypothetical protein